MRKHYIIICVLTGCIIFFHIISQKHDFRKTVIEDKNVCFDFLYNVCLQPFSF